MPKRKIFCLEVFAEESAEIFIFVTPKQMKSLAKNGLKLKVTFV